MCGVVDQVTCTGGTGMPFFPSSNAKQQPSVVGGSICMKEEDQTKMNIFIKTEFG
jgi:hypothetical protein